MMITSNIAVSFRGTNPRRRRRKEATNSAILPFKDISAWLEK